MEDDWLGATYSVYLAHVYVFAILSHIQVPLWFNVSIKYCFETSNIFLYPFMNVLIGFHSHARIITMARMRKK